ncbi:MAG: DUF2339 domain-containing protein [Phycisphaerae bacterium]|nr:DUF2339 domain-containing protein [Phycisphaerae bacterium]
MQIGGRWFAWAGAILVVVAAVFFFKLAYDAGWLGRIPPAVRCWACAAFGALLIAAGEWALRAVNRTAAVSLFSGGIGVLYVTAYATHRVFGLVPESVAFVLLALVAAIGLVITLRGSMVATGVVSLLGGYLAPVLLSGAASSPAALPVYLTALLSVALGLHLLRPGIFEGLRFSAMVMHGLVASAWVASQAREEEEWVLVLGAISAWWLMVQVDAALSAARNVTPRGNPRASFMASAWYVMFGCWILHRANPVDANVLGVFTIAVAALAGLAAWRMGDGLAALRPGTPGAGRALAISLWLQAGILAAAAVALHFDQPDVRGIGQTIGWLALGLGGVELGRRIASQGASIFGLLVLGLALGRMLLIDRELPGLAGAWWAASWITLTPWAALAAGGIGAATLAARRMRLVNRLETSLVATMLSVAAVGLWLLLASDQFVGVATGYAWLCAVAVLLAAQRWGVLQHYFETALGVLLVVAVRWMAVDAGFSRFEPGWNAQAWLPVLNPGLLLALLIAGAWWWSARVLAARDRGAAPSAPWAAGGSAGLLWQALVLLGVVFLAVAVSFEFDRALAQNAALAAPFSPPLARLLWIIVVWTGAGAGLVVATQAPATLPLRAAGWVMIELAALAWLTLGTVVARAAEGVTPAVIVFNLQFAVGAALAGVLLWLARRARRSGETSVRAVAAAATAIAALIGLWLGSLELDRFFEGALGGADARMATRTGLSIYWGVYAIGLLAAGFAWRTAWCRYAGLGLLCVTLMKVVVVDMAEVHTVYRVLSFLALGLLLMVTSIAYSKLAARLLDGRDATATGAEA